MEQKKETAPTLFLLMSAFIMAEPEGEEKLIAEFREIRHKKQLGVLLLTTSRVAWAPGDMVQTFQADYPYQQIKGTSSLILQYLFHNFFPCVAQRISAETSSKIQLQLVLHAGTHANFHFTASNAQEQRQEVCTCVMGWRSRPLMHGALFTR